MAVLARAVSLRVTVPMCLGQQTEWEWLTGWAGQMKWVWSTDWAGHDPMTGRDFG